MYLVVSYRYATIGSNVTMLFFKLIYLQSFVAGTAMTLLHGHFFHLVVADDLHARCCGRAKGLG